MSSFTKLQTPTHIFHILHLEQNFSHLMLSYFWLFLIIAIIALVFLAQKARSKSQHLHMLDSFDVLSLNYDGREFLIGLVAFIACFFLAMSSASTIHFSLIGGGGNISYCDPSSPGQFDTGTNQNSTIPYSDHKIVKRDLQYDNWHKQIISRLKKPSDLSTQSISSYAWNNHNRKFKKQYLKSPTKQNIKLVQSDYHKLNKYYYYPVNTIMHNHPITNILVSILFGFIFFCVGFAGLALATWIWILIYYAVNILLA